MKKKFERKRVQPRWYHDLRDIRLLEKIQKNIW